MKLSDILDLDQLKQDIADGYVKVGHHEDDYDLMIFNYTHKCQNDGHWNDVTRVTRGLIVKVADRRQGLGPWNGEIVARPFDKFFNLGEHPIGTFDPNESVVATEKMDGSLGILYPHPNGGWAIATRGSFHSEQAVKGTEILQRAIARGFTPMDGITYLFEIIYPENRIVLNYGDTEELVLLGCRVAGEDSFWQPRNIETDIFRVPECKIGTLGEVLADLERENREGWVVRFPGRFGPLWERMVKVKQEDYIALHRVVTNLNILTVWEYARGPVGGWDEFRRALPEEHQRWFSEETAKLDSQYEDISGETYRRYFNAVDKINGPEDLGNHEWRKQFAALLQGDEYAHLIFLAADRKESMMNAAIWKMIRPTMTNNRVEREAA